MAESQHQRTRRSLCMRSRNGLVVASPAKLTSIVGSIKSGVSYTYTTLYGYQRLRLARYYSRVFTSSGLGYSCASMTYVGLICVIATTGVPTKATPQISKLTRRKYTHPLALTSLSILVKVRNTPGLTQIRCYIPLRGGMDAQGRYYRS